MAGFICPWPPGATSGAATATAAMTAPTSPGPASLRRSSPRDCPGPRGARPAPGQPSAGGGVAGPGEPLANPATLETLRLVRSRFPGLLLCLSTNGLVLSDALPELLDCGVSTLTVTVNTRSVVCAGHVYRTVGGSADAGAMAAFLSAQQEGVAKAAEAGLTVKINTVVIPGVNTGEIEEIACWAARAGAAVMNLMPLIPQADFRGYEPPAGRSWRRCAPGPVSTSPVHPLQAVQGGRSGCTRRDELHRLPLRFKRQSPAVL
ncbi:radical SAM protein [Flavonifractor plautii]|nr:radical SAM protein [Flavonifractor plautii]